MAAAQLILQFRGTAVEDVDEVTEVEDALFEMLVEGEELDGHDLRGAARNIYVLTGDPEATLARLLPFFARARLLPDLTAACRERAGNACTVLHPPGSGAPFSLD